jgi:hypothetical protein
MGASSRPDGWFSALTVVIFDIGFLLHGRRGSTRNRCMLSLVIRDGLWPALLVNVEEVRSQPCP